jgi:hypothetical protein
MPSGKEGRTMFKNKQIGPKLTVVLIATMVLASGLALTAWAKKPDKPPGDGGQEPLSGTVYFLDSGELWTMDPDGGNQTPLPANVSGEPSRDLHNAERWFVDLLPTSGTYPDSDPRVALFAIRGDGDASATVQLTVDPELEPFHNGGYWNVRWSADDGTVSWVGLRWDSAAGLALEAGIYAATVLYDVDGNVVGLGPADLVVPGFIEEWDEDGDGTTDEFAPDIGGHDWSPDGTSIVYDAPYATRKGLFIADLVAGTSVFLADKGWDPNWAPDGGKIAFRHNQVNERQPERATYVIDTISPDGTDRTTIAKPKSTPYTSAFLGRPRWAPTSSHLVYRHWDLGESVYRVTSEGRDKTNLTDNGTPVAWR